jgi:SNF5 / SMARCB1 / INI1
MLTVHLAGQVDVPIGVRRLCDEILWDTNDPLNTPEGYASSVCSALGLNWDAALSIRRALQEQLRTAQQVQCPANLMPEARHYLLMLIALQKRMAVVTQCRLHYSRWTTQSCTSAKRLPKVTLDRDRCVKPCLDRYSHSSSLIKRCHNPTAKWLQLNTSCGGSAGALGPRLEEADEP